MCVCRNVQHRELKLPKSTRFALITALMVAVPTSEPNGCPVSPPLLSSQNIQSHKKAPASHWARGEIPTSISLALGANREGKDRVKGKVCLERLGSQLAYASGDLSRLDMYS